VIRTHDLSIIRTGRRRGFPPQVAPRLTSEIVTDVKGFLNDPPARVRIKKPLSKPPLARSQTTGHFWQDLPPGLSSICAPQKPPSTCHDRLSLHVPPYYYHRHLTAQPAEEGFETDSGFYREHRLFCCPPRFSPSLSLLKDPPPPVNVWVSPRLTVRSRSRASGHYSAGFLAQKSIRYMRFFAHSPWRRVPGLSPVPFPSASPPSAGVFFFFFQK